MGLDELKRWHWIVIGVLVGLVLSLTRTSMEPPHGARSTKSPQFEADLVTPPLKSGDASVKDLIVYPPIEKVYPVEFKLRTPSKDGRGWVYTQWYLDAETPYKATIDRPSNPGPDETILTHLKRLQGKYSFVKYQYAWWYEPQAVYVLWTTGAVVAIGGVWPTILNLMIGAGFGPKKKEKDDYDLERFGKSGDEESKPIEKKEATAEDHAKLAALQANMEKNLDGFGEGTPGAPGAQSAGQSTEVRKLDGGPVEAANIEKEADDKEYAGEFYPTARVKKQDDPEDPQHPGR